MTASETLVAWLLSPGAAIRSSEQRASGALSLLVIVAVVVSQHVAVNLGAAGTLDPAVFVALGFVKLGLAIIFWITAGALLHCTAMLVKGYGRMGKTIAMVGMSTIPLALLTPLALLCRGVGFASGLLMFTGTVVLLIWTAVLAVRSLSAAYCMDAARSFVAAAVPWVALSFVGIGLLAVYSLVSAAFSLTAQLMKLLTMM